MITLRSSKVSRIADRLPEFYWATKPATGFVGRARILDVGVDGGSVWYSNGTIWAPNAPVILHRLINPLTSSMGTPEEVIMVSGKIPGGVLAIGRLLTCNFLLSKSGTAESTSNFLKIGTNADGITGASSICSALNVNTTVRQLAFTMPNLVINATQVQQGVVGGSANPFGTTTSATFTPRNISNISSDQYISLTGTKTTGGIETISCPFFEAILT